MAISFKGGPFPTGYYPHLCPVVRRVPVGPENLKPLKHLTLLTGMTILGAL